MGATSHTQSRLRDDLTFLGVEAGDVLLIHSSFKSIGEVEGGASTIVSAFEEVLGSEGLILMPSFNLVGGRDERAASWDPEKTASSVGWLTEFFRRMPGTFRSDHYSHSVAARGRDAERFVADHLSDAGMASLWDRAPWGRTYGSNSPMIRAYDRDGKILMLGVDYESSTYCHVVEVMYWNERLSNDPDASFVWLDRDRLGEVWEQTGPMKTGKIGNAGCRLIRIRDYVDGLLRVVRADPDSFDRVKLGTR